MEVQQLRGDRTTNLLPAMDVMHLDPELAKYTRNVSDTL
jgi:hypothetical protein